MQVFIKKVDESSDEREILQKLGLLLPYNIEKKYIVTHYWKNYVHLDSIIEELSDEEKKGVIVDLVKGLLYLHSFGISHGDIHSQNILIHPETLEIKYIDFGEGQLHADEKDRKEDYKMLRDLVWEIVNNGYDIESEEDLQKKKQYTKEFLESIPPIILEDGSIVSIKFLYSE